MELPAPGWHPDPTGRYIDRWWDGDRWTATVRWADDRRAQDPVCRPPGAVGAARPATTTVAGMPVGGPPRSVRVLVALGIALPLTLVAVTVDDATSWIGGVRDGLAQATCERDPGADCS